MTLSRGRAVTGPAVVYVGCVWVIARHRLVAQALTAALGRRVADVRALGWDAQAFDEADVDAAEDVLLMLEDVRTPTALASTCALLTDAPARSLLMTPLREDHAWGALLQAGATEIVVEPDSVDEVVLVLEQVRAGVPVIAEEDRTQLLEAWTRYLAEEEELAERMATLSTRELTVLEALASGRRPSDVGDLLGIAESTVRTHVRAIRRKLGVDSQLRAVLVMHRVRGGSPVPPALPSPRRPQD